MKGFLLLDKQVGETPLECMNRFRVSHLEYSEVKMTYAGRLDPMASGLLLVLTGDAIYSKEKFLSLPKTYECTVILGLSTDTYDILGIPVKRNSFLIKETNDVKVNQIGLEEIKGVLNSFIGTFQQDYPPYSSKTVGGKQLHQIARSGGIDQVKIPQY
jgi:tRNA pseudouridine55 synthase